MVTAWAAAPARWIQENISRDEIRAWLSLVSIQETPDGDGYLIAGELKEWHRVTLLMGHLHTSFSGTQPLYGLPTRSVFRHSDGYQMLVPGFAADGNAANTSAANEWRVHFASDARATDLSGLFLFRHRRRFDFRVASKRDAASSTFAW